MIHRILAAVDGSERAPHVVASAIELASKFGAEVVLFRVVALPQEFPPAAAVAPTHVDREVVQSAEADLTRLAASQPNVRVEPAFVYGGQPWRAIVEHAQKIDADLIVVGSHGWTGWDRVLGTTAGKVANHADRSVLVVHPRK